MNTKKSESRILSEILLDYPKLANSKSRIFRNNTGQGWQGKLISHMNGTATLKNARALRYGLCVGSSDAIGWTTLKVTSDMVGQNVAVFTAIETKSKTGKETEEQKNFILTVREAGGIAGVAKSLDDVGSLLDSYYLL